MWLIIIWYPVMTLQLLMIFVGFCLCWYGICLIIKSITFLIRYLYLCLAYRKAQIRGHDFTISPRALKINGPAVFTAIYHIYLMDHIFLFELWNYIIYKYYWVKFNSWLNSTRHVKLFHFENSLNWTFFRHVRQYI